MAQIYSQVVSRLFQVRNALIKNIKINGIGTYRMPCHKQVWESQVNPSLSKTRDVMVRSGMIFATAYLVVSTCFNLQNLLRRSKIGCTPWLTRPILVDHPTVVIEATLLQRLDAAVSLESTICTLLQFEGACIVYSLNGIQSLPLIYHH